jgi:nucleoside-diphosphate-sugar epimerase
MARVFITGGTGYVGQRLARALVELGHDVRVLTRLESSIRVPRGAAAVVGNALDASSFQDEVCAGDTLVHLVGTPHPSPAKAAEFQRVDLPSILASVAAARHAGAAHVVYVSVAQPAPLMHAYLAVRAQGEAALAASGLTATVLRPWYVLGPGHWWPLVLMPIYAIARLVPSLRAGAERLGLVRLDQMVGALVRAVEQPPAPGTFALVDVRGIRSAGARQAEK